MENKLKYSRPALREMTGMNSSLCQVGSSASGSGSPGLNCNDGNSATASCTPTGSAVLGPYQYCVSGNGDDHPACDVGTGAVSSCYTGSSPS